MWKDGLSGMNLYGICIILSFILGFFFIVFHLRVNKIPSNIIGYLIMLSLACTLYFSKLYTVIVAKDKSINILNASLSSLGGAFGLLFAVLIIGNIYKNGKNSIYTVCILSLPLMYGISKIGCHFAGCCSGIKLKNEDFIFPIQLVESIVFLLTFVISMLLYYHKVNIDYIALEIVICSSLKFILDFFRQDHMGKLVTINQIVCIIFLVIGLIERVYNKCLSD